MSLLVPSLSSNPLLSVSNDWTLSCSSVTVWREGGREGGKGRNGYGDGFIIISFTCCSVGNLLKSSFNFLISDTNLTIVSL